MNRNRKFCLLLMIVAIGLCTIAAILDLNTEKSSEMSFSWAQSSITLKPTENIDVLFTNPDNVPVQLTVVDISAPPELVPYIVASPSTIPENSQQTVTILFIRIPPSALDNITPDIYSVRIGDLLVYLDMTATPPENVTENTENIWLMIDNLNQRIETLENQQLIDNAIIDNQQARIVLLENQHPENLPENFVKIQIDNLRAYYDLTILPRQQFLLENEIAAGVAKAKGDARTTTIELALLATVVSIGFTYGLMSGRIPYIGKHTKLMGGEEGVWGQCPNCGLKFTPAMPKCPNPECQHEFKPIHYPPRGKNKAMKEAEKTELEKQKAKEKTQSEKSKAPESPK